MLTGWEKEELTGRRKYVYEVRPSILLSPITLPHFLYITRDHLPIKENIDPNLSELLLMQLFENQSVVEYWENFANHAFENTTQSVYSHCVLLKPNGAPVPCTFCFSIRRDIMDLPSLVIGALGSRSVKLSA